VTPLARLLPARAQRQKQPRKIAGSQWGISPGFAERKSFWIVKNSLEKSW
jgi:hypothetical protein